MRASTACLPRGASDRYAEYSDAAFLKRLHLDEDVDALAEFWPRRGGPDWDALALATLPNESASYSHG